MGPSFYTREQLGAMPLARLRLIDVKDKSEEDLLQEVINLKLAAQPEPTPVSRAGINTDIRTKEQEEAAQKELDARIAKAKETALGGVELLPEQVEAIESVPESLPEPVPEPEQTPEPVPEPAPKKGGKKSNK